MKSARHGLLFLALIALGLFLVPLRARGEGDDTRPHSGKNPSDDPVIPAFHWLGPIEGQTNIYRCACPVMDIARQMASTRPSTQDLARARAHLQPLYDRGIRTIVSFQTQALPGGSEVTKANVEHVGVALEKTAAGELGMTYVAFPASNTGRDSFEDMADLQVFHWLDMVATNVLNYSGTGGVVFHCNGGHDRTGLVAAYLRIRYQHWSVDDAIAEMRRDGHDWRKFTSDKTALYSWHENHLRAIAAMLKSTNDVTQSATTR